MLSGSREEGTLASEGGVKLLFPPSFEHYGVNIHQLCSIPSDSESESQNMNIMRNID